VKKEWFMMSFLPQEARCVLSVAIAAGLVLWFFTGLAAAKENLLGLDDKIRYDIYLDSHDDLGVIKNIEIVDVRELFNKTFLVIHTDTFSVRTSQGLVALDAVKAILPSYLSAVFQDNPQIK
jgi:hypothetical protein